MPKPSKKRAPAARRPKKAKASDRLVELSIGAGDPLQPGALAKYAALTGEEPGSAKPAPPAGDTRKADRGAALKAAQARWSSRQKGK